MYNFSTGNDGFHVDKISVVQTNVVSDEVFLIQFVITLASFKLIICSIDVTLKVLAENVLFQIIRNPLLHTNYVLRALVLSVRCLNS